MWRCNENSTPQSAAYVTMTQQINKYLAVSVTFKYITNAYQLYYFVEKKSKYTYVNCTPTGLVDLSSDGADVLINDIKEHLVEIEQ